MKLAIIGSRSFTNYLIMCKAIEPLRPTEIVSGGAKGADALAERYALENNLKTTVFLPKFRTDKTVKYHPRWFLERNKEIVEYSNFVLAFWDGKSRGTLHAITHAKKTNTPLRIIHF